MHGHHAAAPRLFLGEACAENHADASAAEVRRTARQRRVLRAACGSASGAVLSRATRCVKRRKTSSAAGGARRRAGTTRRAQPSAGAAAAPACRARGPASRQRRPAMARRGAEARTGQEDEVRAPRRRRHAGTRRPPRASRVDQPRMCAAAPAGIARQHRAADRASRRWHAAAVPGSRPPPACRCWQAKMREPRPAPPRSGHWNTVKRASASPPPGSGTGRPNSTGPDAGDATRAQLAAPAAASAVVKAARSSPSRSSRKRAHRLVVSARRQHAEQLDVVLAEHDRCSCRAHMRAVRAARRHREAQRAHASPRRSEVPHGDHHMVQPDHGRSAITPSFRGAMTPHRRRAATGLEAPQQAGFDEHHMPGSHAWPYLAALPLGRRHAARPRVAGAATARSERTWRWSAPASPASPPRCTCAGPGWTWRWWKPRSRAGAPPAATTARSSRRCRGPTRRTSSARHGDAGRALRPAAARLRLHPVRPRARGAASRPKPSRPAGCSPSTAPAA